MRYVIVGNSASATAAVEAIRECDKKGLITIISDEPYINYSRPLISYFLGRKLSREKISYRGKEFYRDNNVELILNKKAKRLNVRQKELTLIDNQKIKFDKLLIATGGIPIIPEIKGINLNGVFTFTKLADAEAIEKYISANKVKRAVVVGGGLIGLKATESLIELGIGIIIVELTDRILSATFDKRASDVIAAGLKRIGCNLITNNTVAEIKGKEQKVVEVVLKDKRKIPAELVIAAIGTRPNIELVKDTKVKIDRGILVDDFMQTNIKDIYAAGDCCQGKDLLLDITRPIAIWPTAIQQGKIAGYNMAGVKKRYSGGFAMNSVELCRIPTISVGLTNPEKGNYQVLEYLDKNRSIYKKIVLRNNRVVGAIFVGNIERAGIYTGLIKDRVSVLSFKEHLLKEDFGLINLPREYRKHLVSGVVAIV